MFNQNKDRVGQKFYDSGAWRRCRRAFIEYKFGICNRCSNAGEIVHHRIHIDANNINNPAITLNFDNLELLCNKCHQTHHMIGNQHRRAAVLPGGLVFDDDGNIIQVLVKT